MKTPKPKLKPKPQSSPVPAANSAAISDETLFAESVEKQSNPVEVVPSTKKKKRSVNDGQGEAVSRNLEASDSKSTQASTKPIETESDTAETAEPVAHPSQKKQSSFRGDGGFGLGKMKELSEALKKAHQVQEGAKKLQADLEQMEVEAESSDGSVKVVMNGSQNPLSVTIAPSAVDAGAQVLNDLVLEAWSSAYQKSAATLRSRMEELTGGLNLPGM